MSKPASDMAYERLRTDMIRQRWQGGTWLREDELAAELGTSRTPVREALRRLASEGMVVHVPNRGVRVQSLDAHDVLDITAIRALIEAYAASVAATRILPQELDELRDACDQMTSCVDDVDPDFGLITEANDRFHHGVIAAARSNHLLHILGQVRRPAITLRTFRQYTRGELVRSARQHADVLAALEAADSDWAHASMSAHLLTARSALLRGADDLMESLGPANPADSPNTPRGG